MYKSVLSFAQQLMNRRFLILFIACHIIFLIANYPFLQYALSRPLTHNTPLVHSWFDDYYVYIAQIREGRDDGWSSPNLYTAETTPAKTTWIFYIFLGKLSKITHLGPIATYHIARLVAFEVFLVTMYLLAFAFLGKYASMGGLLGILSVPIIDVFGWKPFIESYSTWIPKAWETMNPFVRMDGAPHHTVSTILMLASILYSFSFIKKAQLSLYLLTIFCALLSTLVNPSSALLLVFGLSGTLIIWASVNWIRKRIIKFTSVLLPFSIMAVCLMAIFYIKWNLVRGPDQAAMWGDISLFESFPNYNSDYFKGELPFVVIAFIYGLIAVFKNPTVLNIFILLWLVLPYILLPYAALLGFAKFRISFLVSYLPLGILTTQAITAFLKKFPQPHVKTILIVIALILFSALSYNSWDYQMPNVQSYSWYNHIPDEVSLSAIEYLGTRTKPYDVVLARERTGIVIPAYIQAKSFVGRMSFTLDFDKKKAIVDSFYRGQMTKNEVIQLLSTYKIKYIFQGPVENTGIDLLYLYGDLFTILYKNTNTTIFQVKM